MELDDLGDLFQPKCMCCPCTQMTAAPCVEENPESINGNAAPNITHQLIQRSDSSKERASARCGGRNVSQLWDVSVDVGLEEIVMCCIVNHQRWAWPPSPQAGGAW